MIIETIKKALGEELAAQVEAALKGKGKDGKDIELGITNDGTLVPATKYEEEKQLRIASESTIKDRDKQLEELKQIDAAGLQAEIQRLQDENTTAKANYEKQVADIKLDAALTAAIHGAKGKNATAIKALIARDKLKLKDDGNIEGLDLESIKTTDPYLFEQIETKPEGNPPAGGGAPGVGDPEKMSYDEYKAWREKQ